MPDAHLVSWKESNFFKFLEFLSDIYDPEGEALLIRLNDDPLQIYPPRVRRVLERQESQARPPELPPPYADAVETLTLGCLVSMGSNKRPDIYIKYIEDSRCGAISYWDGSPSNRTIRETISQPLREIAREGLVKVFGVDRGFDKEAWLREFDNRGIPRPGGMGTPFRSNGG